MNTCICVAITRAHWLATRIAAAGVILTIAACGSSRSPTSPSSPATPTGTPQVTLTSLDIPNRTAVVTWQTIQGATEYEIATGTAAGATDVSKFNIPSGTASATLSDLPPNTTVHVQVTAHNAAGAGGSGATSFYLVDFRSIIETLFFNSGPYSAVQFGAGQPFDRMEGWAPGTRIRILLANEVEDLRPTAEKVAQQLADVTGGALTAFVDSGGDNRWTSASQGPVGTVKVVSTRELPASQGALCEAAGGGGSFDCARADPDLRPIRSRVVLWMGPDLKPGNRHAVFVHELGHALLGLGHWDGYFDAPGAMGLACRPNRPEMQFPYLMMCGRQEEITNGFVPAVRTDFTPIEAEAVRRVYAAGLRPGASRAEFASRGLLP